MLERLQKEGSSLSDASQGDDQQDILERAKAKAKAKEAKNPRTLERSSSETLRILRHSRRIVMTGLNLSERGSPLILAGRCPVH